MVVENRLAGDRLEFYPHQIEYDSIVLDGHSGNVTFEAMKWLMKHDIHLTLLNWNGNSLGTLLPKEPKSGKLRVSQYSKYLDTKTRFEIAARIVEQKVQQTRNLLTELSRFYPEEIDVGRVDKVFEVERDNFCHSNQSIPNLMNYEGRIAVFYWDRLASIFNRICPKFHFQSRMNKSYSWNMNASDEINALLNYGYSMLESEVRRAINAVGLDPSVGFLHELAQSKEPLVYDIQELFRWIIDISVIQFLEEKRLRKPDFIVTENYHVRLGQFASKALIEKIKINFNRKVGYKNNKNYSYQAILQDNVQQLANFVSDKKLKLDSLFSIPPFKLERNDAQDLRQRILAMSPIERKRLGINKSTLWYMKRNIESGKSIKIYDKVYVRLSPMKQGAGK